MFKKKPKEEVSIKETPLPASVKAAVKFIDNELSIVGEARDKIITALGMVAIAEAKTTVEPEPTKEFYCATCGNITTDYKLNKKDVAVCKECLKDYEN